MKKAKELSIQVYYVLDNHQLERIVKIKPQSKEDFIFLVGIGQAKYDLYGEDIINIIKTFLHKNKE